MSVGGSFSIPPDSIKDSLLETIPGTISCLQSGHDGPAPQVIDESMNLTRNLIETIQDNPRQQFKLRNSIIQATKYIKTHGYILKESDKNLGLVLMHKDVYNELVNDELNEETFKQVESYPHFTIVSIIKQILNYCKMNTQYKKQICEFIKTHTEPSPFYIIPKIHKPTLKSRPITADHSSTLSILSKQLNNILNEKVKLIPAISRNSKQVVNQLERIKLPEDVWFLTYDVERLYPSIDVDDAMKILTKAYPDIFLKNNGYWLRILEVIMKQCHVTTKGKVFKQLKGTATGTAVAPSFANLYAHHKFKETIRTIKGIIINIRYIDDGFVVGRTKNTVLNLINALQSASNLNLTYEVSQVEAIYLDIKIYKGPRFNKERILDTKIYTKPMSKFLYLQGKSNHPEHVFKGIIHGEMIRYLRNTNNEDIWLKEIKNLFSRLSRRGYTAKWLRTIKTKIKFKDRYKYLKHKPDLEKPFERWTCATYHPLTKHKWKALTRWSKSNLNKKVIEKWPTQLVFRQSTTVRKLLIRAKDQPQQNEQGQQLRQSKQEQQPEQPEQK